MASLIFSIAIDNAPSATSSGVYPIPSPNCLNFFSVIEMLSESFPDGPNNFGKNSG